MPKYLQFLNNPKPHPRFWTKVNKVVDTNGNMGTKASFTTQEVKSFFLNQDDDVDRFLEIPLPYGPFFHEIGLPKETGGGCYLSNQKGMSEYGKITKDRNMERHPYLIIRDQNKTTSPSELYPEHYDNLQTLIKEFVNKKQREMKDSKCQIFITLKTFLKEKLNFLLRRKKEL